MFASRGMFGQRLETFLAVRSGGGDTCVLLCMLLVTGGWIEVNNDDEQPTVHWTDTPNPHPHQKIICPKQETEKTQHLIINNVLEWGTYTEHEKLLNIIPK